MSTFKKTLLVFSTAPLLMLAACEGYEYQPYHGSPYDNERTAGSGVEYVLAKMAPKKGPVVESEMKKAEEEPAPAPAAEEKDEAEPTPPPAHDGEEMFNKMQKK